MAKQARTLLWITGATQGIGAALARHVPYDGTRVINVSRRQHPEYETVIADLTDPASWDGITESFARELADFHGERAIFIHNANFRGEVGPAGTTDPAVYRQQVYANAAAPLILAEAFIRSCRPDYESGLVLISSASARFAMEGFSVYGAAKAGMEQWVRAVRAERKRAGQHPWVIAIRPGFVATESVRDSAERFAQGEAFPGGAAVKEALDSGNYLTPQQSAEQIWGLLPPDPDGRNVLFIGQFVEGTGVAATSG